MDRKGENVSKIHICVMLRLAVPFNHSLPKSLPLHEYIIIAWTLFWESQIGTIQKILYRPVIHGRPGLTQYFSLAHVRPGPVRYQKILGPHLIRCAKIFFILAQNRSGDHWYKPSLIIVISYNIIGILILVVVFAIKIWIINGCQLMA